MLLIPGPFSEPAGAGGPSLVHNIIMEAAQDFGKMSSHRMFGAMFET